MVRKYRNRSCEFQGVKYDSLKEGNYALHLHYEQMAREIQRWEPKPKYRLVVNGAPICTIVPDFLVVTRDGKTEVHEIKSKPTMTPVWRLKKKLFEVLYPDIIYRVIV